MGSITNVAAILFEDYSAFSRCGAATLFLCISIVGGASLALAFAAGSRSIRTIASVAVAAATGSL